MNWLRLRLREYVRFEVVLCAACAHGAKKRKTEMFIIF